MKKMKRTLCLLLVLAMSLSLMNLPAFAVTDPSSESACTMEEHKHTEACYAPGEPVLTCEEEHEHTEACYTPGEPVLSCTLEEHEHSEDCAAAPVVEDDPEETDTTQLPALFDLREAKKGGGGDVEGNLQTDPFGKIENNENLSQYEGGTPITVGDKAIVFKQSTDAIVVVPAGCTSTWDKIKEALFAQTNDGNLDNIKKVSVYQVDPSKDVTYVVHKTSITVGKDGVVIVNGDLSHITWGTAPGQHEEPETISVTVTKEWQDAKGELLTDHPSSVTVQLYKGGTAEGSEVTLNAPDWAYTWDKLDKDGNYTVKEVEIEGYESKVTGDATNGFTITNKAKPTDPPPPPPPETGSLTVTKAVAGIETADLSRLDGQTFTFTVTGEDYSETVTVTAKVENGDVTYTSNPETLSGLPCGEYTITETEPTDAPEGYTWENVSFSGDDADSDADGFQVIVGEANKDVTVTATNTYESEEPDNPEQGTGDLTIHKVVEALGNPIVEDVDFTFNVQGPDAVKGNTYTADGNQSVLFDETGKATVTIKGQGNVTVKGLPAGEYTISENAPNGPEGYTWKGVSFKNHSDQDKDAQITVCVGTDNGSKNVQVNAHNRYEKTPDPEPKTVNLAVTKAVKYDKTASNAPDAEKMFTIRVQLGDVENIFAQTIHADDGLRTTYYLGDGVYEISLKAGETATIHKIPVGTKYTVLEDDPGAGWTKSGEVTAATVLTENAAVTVTNHYFDAKKGTVSVTKQWDGGESYRPQKVNVQLYRCIGTSEQEAVESPQVMNATNEWTASWKNLPLYTETGERYTYSVKEVSVEYSTAKGYTADGRDGNLIRVRGAAKEILGAWMVSESGTMSAAATATNGYGNNIALKNSWVPARNIGNAGLEIHKVEEGSSKAIPGVEFKLTGPGVAYENGVTATTDVKGYASFGGLTEGTYTLVETKAAEGYVRPDTEWKITVTKGSLSSVKELPDPSVAGENHWVLTHDKNDEGLSYMTITNEPIPVEPILGKISVTKKVVGPATDKEFTFLVLDADGKAVATLKVKPGETKTIEDLSCGTYTIVEPATQNSFNEDGFEYKGVTFAAVEGTDGTVSENGKSITVNVTEDETYAVTATNTYEKVEPETGALTVTKTVVDATADHSVPADAAFTIKVKLGGEDTPATLAEGGVFNGLGTYTFRLKGGESAAINGIPAGTAYEVSEDNPGRGWVSAVNNGSGGIDGEASVSVTNTWNGTRDTGTTDPSTGSLKITKVIDGGGEAATEEVFTFTVAGPDGFNQSVEITGAGEVTLNDLEPGNYTVTESDADISGYNWEKSGDGSVTVTADATAEVTVTNTYRTEVIVPDPETPTTRPDPRPTPRPTPTPDPEPETDIPDDPTPRVDVPDAPTPEVNIPDDPTPKTDIPDAPTPEVNIPDDPTPKTDIPDVQPPMISWPPVVEVPEEDIPDEDVPMASVPKTGDISLVWYAAALLSACGLSALTIKKRKDEEQD